MWNFVSLPLMIKQHSTSFLLLLFEWKGWNKVRSDLNFNSAITYASAYNFIKAFKLGFDFKSQSTSVDFPFLPCFLTRGSPYRVAVCLRIFEITTAEKMFHERSKTSWFHFYSNKQRTPSRASAESKNKEKKLASCFPYTSFPRFIHLYRLDDILIALAAVH